MERGEGVDDGVSPRADSIRLRGRSQELLDRARQLRRRSQQLLEAREELSVRIAGEWTAAEGSPPRRARGARRVS